MDVAEPCDLGHRRETAAGWWCRPGSRPAPSPSHAQLNLRLLPTSLPVGETLPGTRDPGEDAPADSTRYFKHLRALDKDVC